MTITMMVYLLISKRNMMEFLKERSHQSRQSKAVVLQPEQQVFLLAGLQQKPLRVKQAAIIKRGFKERNRLALIAIKKSPDTDPESPLLKLKNSDIEIRPIRQKSYDMATKINSLATMVQNFVHPRVAMEAIDFFSEPRRSCRRFRTKDA